MAPVQVARLFPGLLRFGDVPEVGSLIAPRPAVWEVGTSDALIDASWAAEDERRMARAYRALGASDQFHVDRFDVRHEWHGPVAYQVLEHALKPATSAKNRLA